LIYFSRGSVSFFRNESSQHCSGKRNGFVKSLNHHHVNYLDYLFQISTKKLHSDDLSRMHYVAADVDGEVNGTSSFISSSSRVSLCALYSSWIVVIG
jgi:hypothetical protein